MNSKYCLESFASFNQINQASTNQSPSKQTFSFSKGSRFQQPKPNCPRNTYGGDFFAKKTSGTAIGYGTKSDFTRCLTVSPSANKYNLKSFWDENAAKKRGASFALSRDKVSFNSYISKQQLAVPPATQYSNHKNFKAKAPVYSLRQKTTVVDKTMTIEPQNRNPGPGSYNNPENDSHRSGKHASKFQNVSYSQSKQRRFAPSQTIVPGPGNYKEIQGMSKTGHYVLSNNKGGTKAKFDQTKRQSLFEQVFKRQLSNPGPGYYKAPSEFGQYDGDIYKQLQDTKRAQNGWKIQSERAGKK